MSEWSQTRQADLGGSAVRFKGELGAATNSLTCASETQGGPHREGKSLGGWHGTLCDGKPHGKEPLLEGGLSRGLGCRDSPGRPHSE